VKPSIESLKQNKWIPDNKNYESDKPFSSLRKLYKKDEVEIDNTPFYKNPYFIVGAVVTVIVIVGGLCYWYNTSGVVEPENVVRSNLTSGIESSTNISNLVEELTPTTPMDNVNRSIENDTNLTVNPFNDNDPILNSMSPSERADYEHYFRNPNSSGSESDSSNGSA
jgi:hypothetical protein